VSPTQGVIGDAWGMYRRHWQHFLSISFIVYASVALISLVLTLLLSWFGALLGGVVSLIAAFWLQGALVRAVEDVRDGRADMSLGQTFESVRPHLGSIIVAGFLAGLAIVIGLILLIVPGLVLLTWWILIVPAIVLEGKSAGESFSRSRELVRGYGWNVFGVIILTLLIYIGISIVLRLILTPLADWLESFVASIVVGTLAIPLLAVTWTLLYFRLREAKEPATPAVEPAV
jgi:hypothetical protein